LTNSAEKRFAPQLWPFQSQQGRQLECQLPGWGRQRKTRLQSEKELGRASQNTRPEKFSVWEQFRISQRPVQEKNAGLREDDLQSLEELPPSIRTEGILMVDQEILIVDEEILMVDH
jgi:hypothetical protein